MTVRDDLIAAKALIDTPEKFACDGKTSGWSLNDAIENIAGDDDIRWGRMWKALRSSLPQVPKPATGFIEYSREQPHPVVMALVDRAIAGEAE